MCQFNCGLCGSKLYSVRSYLSHYSLHKNVKNILFPCCYEFCNRNFVKFVSLKSHVTRDHKTLLHRPSPYDCIKESICCFVCGNKFITLKELLSHLKYEISSEQPIPCPYLQCKNIFTKHSSLTSHISRKHKFVNKLTHLKESFRQNDDADFRDVTDNNEDHTIQSSSEDENSESSLLYLQKLYTQSLALFYMKLEAVNLVSVTTLNSLVSDTADLQGTSNQILKKRIEQDVKFGDIRNLTKVQKLIDDNEFSKNTTGNSAIFDTNFKRKRYYSKHFSYVKPVEMYLGLGENNEKCVYHYLPLKESLNFLLQDKSVKEQILNPLKTEKGVFEDVSDGLAFLNNAYFKDNKNALKLVIYQDAFEIVNPLGSAKKTYKLLGFYYTLLDIYPCHRSKIDPMQLLILCREKDFLYFNNGITVMERLVSDIKELSVGLSVNGNLIKANVACILGDNLGSHFIGGFCTNFSNEQYFCRYCLMTKSSYGDKPLSIRFASERTPESYEESLKYISDNELNHYDGIKFSSLFNELSGFHVTKGLPPCLGHDLFEGVVKYDLALYLKNIVSVKKWFDIRTLNYLISKFSYRSPDLENKPIQLKDKFDTIGGHAVQIWTLLRLLPLIVSRYVKDPLDECWNAILLLRLITEYICAPRVSLTHICYLHQLLDNYVSERCRLFPEKPLRPKHHYVHHYAHLMLQFGPLIRVWTMRFESKHSYFKRCIRSTKNFKNVTKTLSEKHQLLQSYYAAGNLFSLSSVFNGVISEFSLSSVGSLEIHNYVCQNLDVADLKVSGQCMIGNTIIKAGHCIVLNTSEACIGFVQIELFLICVTGQIKVLCKYSQTARSDSGIYNVDFETGNLMIINENDVADWTPLVLYDKKISLKHYPIESM